MKLKDLQTINVEIYFSKISDPAFSESQAQSIGNKTFANVGLRNNIRV